MTLTPVEIRHLKPAKSVVGGYQRTAVDGLLDEQLARHGLDTAIAVYALLDNARRARLHRSLEEYRFDIGRLFAPFSRVAAANPHAAAHSQ